jgi:hypothetical protein
VTEINQTYLQYESAKERLSKANLTFKQASNQKNAGVSGITGYQEALSRAN